MVLLNVFCELLTLATTCHFVVLALAPRRSQNQACVETAWLTIIPAAGKISFEEWTAMMMGRVGRAESGLNCGGHHGLTRYTAPISGISCNFCRDLIAVGSLASGCRCVSRAFIAQIDFVSHRGRYRFSAPIFLKTEEVPSFDNIFLKALHQSFFFRKCPVSGVGKFPIPVCAKPKRSTVFLRLRL